MKIAILKQILLSYLFDSGLYWNATLSKVTYNFDHNTLTTLHIVVSYYKNINFMMFWTLLKATQKERDKSPVQNTLYIYAAVWLCAIFPQVVVVSAYFCATYAHFYLSTFFFLLLESLLVYVYFDCLYILPF